MTDGMVLMSGSDLYDRLEDMGRLDRYAPILSMNGIDPDAPRPIDVDDVQEPWRRFQTPPYLDEPSGQICRDWYWAMPGDADDDVRYRYDTTVDVDPMLRVPAGLVA